MAGKQNVAFAVDDVDCTRQGRAGQGWAGLAASPKTPLAPLATPLPSGTCLLSPPLDDRLMRLHFPADDDENSQSA